MRITSILAFVALSSATASWAAKTESSEMPAKQASRSAAPAPSEPTAAPTKPATIADVVASDWSKYDLGAKGHLDKAEFDKWLTDLRAAANQSAPDAQWLKQAFVQTDTDKDAKVTSTELTRFLSAGG